MSKAFVKEAEDEADPPDADPPDGAPAIPRGLKNYMTPHGRRQLQDELRSLAAGRAPESGRDRRLGGRQRRPLGKRRLHLWQAPAARDRPPHPLSDEAAGERRGGRPGAAEAPRPGVFWRDRHLCRRARRRAARSRSSASTRPTFRRGQVSWISPIARALIKAREGDIVELRAPAGREEIEVLAIRYGGDKEVG